MKKEKTLIILGAGGHGRVVADTAEVLGQWKEIIFYDDNYPEFQASGPWKVMGKIIDFNRLDQLSVEVALGIGNNDVRLKLTKKLLDKGFKLPVIIHPTAYISKYSSVGEGSVLFAHAVVNIGSKIGQGSIINTGAKVDHDCILGDGVHISPGAHLAGGVKIGLLSWIGIGSSIKQGINIGSKVTVGAGSAVIKDIIDGLTVVGVPARVHMK